MRSKFVLPKVIGLAAAFALAGAATKPVPNVPGTASYKPPAPNYDTAPEPWRSYLLKAREVDAIKDPMQRCLAFPPIPGSNWPAS
jgi:hypothetical protein